MKSISPVAIAFAVLALALGAAGCGDDGEPGSDRDGAGDDRAMTATAPDRDGREQAEDGERGGDGRERDGGSDSGDGSTAPPRPAEPGDRYVPAERDRKIQGDGSIERFGRSLPEDEADDVVAVAVGYHDARAEGDWARACGLLARSVRTTLEQRAEQLADGGGCAAGMRALSAGVPRQAVAEEARSIRFNEVRVKGDRAFAIFKSASIPNGTLPLVRENGQWKVSLLAGAPL